MAAVLESGDLLSQFAAWTRWRLSPVGRAAVAFRRHRHDYYSYLSDLLADSRGKRTMLDIFMRDAQRYNGRPRGILTQHWIARHQEGAELMETWGGTLPEQDLLVLGAAVEAGGPGAIESALKDVARLAQRDTESKRQFLSTILIGVIALFLALAVLIGLPLFFVPLLKKSFSFVPLDMWGPLGRKLLAFADFVRFAWPLLLGALLALVFATLLSMPRWTGRVRAWMDRRVLPYRLYRDARAAEFIATLASILKRRGNVSMNLREALELVRTRANPWLQSHCSRMVNRLDQQNDDGAGVLDTGLFSKDSIYYIADMMETLGPDEGLQAAGLRLEQYIARTIARSARVLELVLVAVGVGTMFLMSAWLMLCMGELKTATALVFSR